MHFTGTYKHIIYCTCTYVIYMYTYIIYMYHACIYITTFENWKHKIVRKFRDHATWDRTFLSQGPRTLGDLNQMIFVKYFVYVWTCVCVWVCVNSCVSGMWWVHSFYKILKRVLHQKQLKHQYCIHNFILLTQVYPARRTFFIIISLLKIGFPAVSLVKNPPATKIWVGSLHQENPAGERNGNLLKYSCLENPMERQSGRLQSMGLQNSQTWLSN